MFVRPLPPAVCALLASALLAAGLGGCAAAPLYVSSASRGGVTGGEVPRDSRGEPVWGLIRPAPAPAVGADTAEGSRTDSPPRRR